MGRTSWITWVVVAAVALAAVVFAVAFLMEPADDEMQDHGEEGAVDEEEGAHQEDWVTRASSGSGRAVLDGGVIWA